MSLDAFYQLKLFDYVEPSLILAGYVTGNIYYGYQDGDRELTDYCIINLTSIDDDVPSEVVYEYTDDPINNPSKQIEEHVIYRARLQFTLDFFGNEAMSRARHMRALFASTAMIELAQSQNIGFVKYGDMANISEIVNVKYQNRIAFPVTVNISFTYTQLIGTYGQVRVAGTTQAGGPTMDKIITENG